MIANRLGRLRHLWVASGSLRGLSTLQFSRLEACRLAAGRLGAASACSKAPTHRRCRIAAMSTAAPPVAADGVPQWQELDALRKQLADLQASGLEVTNIYKIREGYKGTLLGLDRGKMLRVATSADEGLTAHRFSIGSAVLLSNPAVLVRDCLKVTQWHSACASLHEVFRHNVSRAHARVQHACR